MKQLFFAGSFAIATFLAYGINNHSEGTQLSQAGVSQKANYDTTPGSKKDTSRRKKGQSWGKDSTSMRDTGMSRRDSTQQQ